MPTVLLTGVAGGIARYLVPELLAHGYRIRGFDLKAAPYPEVETVIGDIRNFDEVRAATDGVDVVCHLAAIPSDALPMPQLFPINVTGTAHVLEAAHQCGVHRVVHASSIRAYGLIAPKNPVRPAFLPINEEHPALSAEGYGMTKAAADTLARCYSLRGLSVIVLRPGGVIDFAKGRGGEWNPLDAGVHGPDVAQAFRLALETRREFGIYNVVSMHRYNRQGRPQTPEERQAELESLAIGPDICEPEFWSGKGNVYAIDRIRRELGYQPTW